MARGPLLIYYSEDKRLSEVIWVYKIVKESQKKELTIICKETDRNLSCEMETSESCKWEFLTEKLISSVIEKFSVAFEWRKEYWIAI